MYSPIYKTGYKMYALFRQKRLRQVQITYFYTLKRRQIDKKEKTKEVKKEKNSDSKAEVTVTRRVTSPFESRSIFLVASLFFSFLLFCCPYVKACHLYLTKTCLSKTFVLLVPWLVVFRIKHEVFSPFCQSNQQPFAFSSTWPRRKKT